MKGKETKHVTAFRQSHLKSNEMIELCLEGWIGEMMGKGEKAQHNGAFVLTNMRACFYRKGIFGEVFEAMPISKITSVETRSMMGYRVIRLHTSHDDLAFKSFEAKELFDFAYSRIEELRKSEDALSTASLSTSNPLSQIKELASLREAGLLSEAEFQGKKAELLSRL